MNPILLDKKDYSEQDMQKLYQLNQLCESLYHDKKIMMIQVRFPFNIELIAIGCDYSEFIVGSTYSV